MDGEEGVAPGQACVIYEGPEPRARVLGGGTIRAAVGAAREKALGTELHAAFQGA